MKPAAPVPPLPAADQSLLVLLPPVLRAVVRALGVSRAREWLTERGGRSFCVPLGRDGAQDLTQDEIARLRHTLARHMDADGRVTFPKADKLLIHFRDARIRRERRRTSLAALALRYRLTTRQIQNICREDDGRQHRLF